jgi:2-polyprenyl-3-methyl-5-hydroxy-6-metoxy-1,4-benzoquinol methylase
MKHAKSVTGIDKEIEEIKKLRKKGYDNIIAGDAEKIKLKQKFDVIVAGNVLEHLSNPGLFLANMKNHLKEDGKIIITTDNEGGFISFFHTLCLGYISENPDHTMIFNYSHLRELITREGLKIDKYYYYMPSDTPKHRSTSFILRTYSKIKRTLLAFFLMLRKNFAPSCILILTKKI